MSVEEEANHGGFSTTGIHLKVASFTYDVILLRDGSQQCSYSIQTDEKLKQEKQGQNTGYLQ